MAHTRLEARSDEGIDRSQPLAFRWNGKPHSGFAGDTIVSALAAAGVMIFSRSFKYRHPRGILTADFNDPNCMVQVGDEPNVRGAHRLLAEGIDVTSQGTWPSLRLDAKMVARAAGPALGPGFYYKTFMRPRALWPLYQKVLRRFSGGGTVAPDTDHGHYDKRYAHPDVIVAGAGPAGLAAAASAAESGASVMLVDEQHSVGGHLRWSGPEAAALATELEQRALAAGVEILTDSVVFGRYDHNWIGIVQRSHPAVRERLIKARAGILVVAPGLIERPYVFEGNDLPGVMLSGAARRLINLYSVQPGSRAVVFTANDDGVHAARDLEGAGVEVAAVVDPRSDRFVVRARGGSSLRSVELRGGTKIEADLLVMATGWTAPTSLLNMAGVRPEYDAASARFVARDLPDDVMATGGLVGDGTHADLAAHGEAVGREAARRAASISAAKAASIPAAVKEPAREAPDPSPIPDLAPDPHPALFVGSAGGFVDFSEDVTAKDLSVAADEGYDSLELAKRYTTATMGPVQGKLEVVNAAAAHLAATGRKLQEIGTTTWRPPYAPVSLGALAGRNFEPIRYSALQPYHDSVGAERIVAGQWIRPDRYGNPSSEVNAVRNGVGIIDVSPLGKLDLRGRGVPRLLEMVYTNRWSKLAVGSVRYGLMCAEDGVILDDGVTGRLADDRYIMTTTSSGAGTVYEWLDEWLQTAFPEWDVRITPVTDGFTSINVAGPRSRELVGRLVSDIDVSRDAFPYMRVRTGTVAGVPNCFIWRIGFTGELSFEIHVPAGYGLHVWQQLLEEGADLGVTPFGLEAQRIMRLEKGHFIVGQDTDGLTRANATGLDSLIKLDKTDFAGKPELQWESEQPESVVVGLQTPDPTLVPPEASQILSKGAIIGRVTSSRMSPTLGRSICLGLIAFEHAIPGEFLDLLLPDGTTRAIEVMEHHAHFDPNGGRLRA